MDDLLKESASVHKVSDVKTAISQLRIWSENQRQKFLNKQLLDHQNLMEQSGIRKLEQQLNSDKFSESNKEISIENKTLISTLTEVHPLAILFKILLSLDIYCVALVTHHLIVQLSSPTSHQLSGSLLLRIISSSNNEATNKSVVPNSKYDLANDSSENINQDCSSDAVALSLKKPKQPFLKKRSGLLRYLPKQNKSVPRKSKPTISQDLDSESQIKTNLKIKSAFQINKFLSQKTKVNKKKELICADGNSTEDNQNVEIEISNCDDSLNTENKELAEFEMLENYAQNSSFNSDSSVVQRVLQGKSIQPINQAKNLALQFNLILMNQKDQPKLL
ncbi:uncharacterized protein CEXT_536551 [Caerostris extrusa]|uniref:Uncharacterized protein n=1 Tax=Caerostris extrusa TaxID=172846 RepID=A0AAV4TSZ7_CAEEX|nr:uncharacterized protein CEXT_536551 [Caerostris extrusa]